MPGGLEMVDDGQRHEHRATPVAHVVEVYVKPFANENDFAGNGGDKFPGEQKVME